MFATACVARNPCTWWRCWSWVPCNARTSAWNQVLCQFDQTSHYDVPLTSAWICHTCHHRVPGNPCIFALRPRACQLTVQSIFSLTIVNSPVRRWVVQDHQNRSIGMLLFVLQKELVRFLGYFGGEIIIVRVFILFLAWLALLYMWLATQFRLSTYILVSCAVITDTPVPTFPFHPHHTYRLQFCSCNIYYSSTNQTTCSNPVVCTTRRIHSNTSQRRRSYSRALVAWRRKYSSHGRVSTAPPCNSHYWSLCHDYARTAPLTDLTSTGSMLVSWWRHLQSARRARLGRDASFPLSPLIAVERPRFVVLNHFRIRSRTRTWSSVMKMTMLGQLASGLRHFGSSVLLLPPPCLAQIEATLPEKGQ